MNLCCDRPLVTPGDNVCCKFEGPQQTALAPAPISGWAEFVEPTAQLKHQAVPPVCAGNWADGCYAACLQILSTVAEHHSNLVPWQIVAQKTGAVLRHVPLTQDGQEVDMKVTCAVCLVCMQFELCPYLCNPRLAAASNAQALSQPGSCPFIKTCAGRSWSPCWC